MLMIHLFGDVSDDQRDTVARKDYVETLVAPGRRVAALAAQLGNNRKGIDALTAFCSADAVKLLASLARNNYWLCELLRASLLVDSSGQEEITVDCVARAVEHITKAARERMNVHKPAAQLTVLEAGERVAAGVLLVNQQQDQVELVLNPVFQFRKAK